jgi:hypothetical protein
MSQDFNHFDRHRISNQVKRLVVVVSVISLFAGCSQLPIKVGVDDDQASSQANEEGLSVAPGPSEQKSEEAEEQRSPFDLDLDLDERKQSELDSALKRLIKDLETAMLEANEGIDVNEDGTYLVRKGDYLDKIIKQTVGNYPFKRDILRKAFVLANPKVFRRSNPNWMYANKKMRIPAVDDIKKVIFKDQSKGKSSSKDPYAGWVRYP